MNSNDILVTDLSGVSQFLDKTLDDLIVGSHMRSQEFQDDFLVDHRILDQHDDPESTAAVENLVAEHRAGGGYALWISHDAAQLARVAQSVLRLEAGRVVEAAA